MATFTITLDDDNSDLGGINAGGSFAFVDAYGNGQADVINVYISPSYNGDLSNFADIWADPSDTINLILDPGYRPAGDVSVTNAYATIAGSPTHYIDFNGSASDANGGLHSGAITVTNGSLSDYLVTGTSGDDLIDTAYTGDPEGDMVDNNDHSDSSNDDSIEAGSGNDTIEAGDGDDTVHAGEGDDSIVGGAGDDQLTGGQGDDTFVIAPGDGADTITDFGAGITGPTDDGIQSNNDFVDLSGFYNTASRDAVNAADADPNNDFKTALNILRADAADGNIDGIIDGIDYSAQIGDIDLTLENGGSPVTGVDLNFDTTNVVCFTRGTLIRTAQGDVPVETLKPGALVATRDAGNQSLRWIGYRRLDAKTLQGGTNLRPIRIAAGALGSGLPLRDLLVSPQHRLLVRSAIAERMFGTNEVLVAAKHLLRLNGVDVAEELDEIEYWHFMFEDHQVVFAEGAEAESLYAGKEALLSIAPAALREIHALFPDIAQGSAPNPVRLLIKGRQGRRLAERHQRNQRALTQPGFLPSPPRPRPANVQGEAR